MCGIFGVYIKEGSSIKPKTLKRLLASLMVFSESRGKEASGIAARLNDEIIINKQPKRAKLFIKSKSYKKTIEKVISKSFINNRLASTIGIIGHSRLVTNGLQYQNKNNQPVIREGIIGIHNGIIVNEYDISKKYSIKKESNLDSEILVGLIRSFEKKGFSLFESIKKAFSEIEGSASIGLLFNDYDCSILATNTGSLFLYKTTDLIIFASEKYILKKTLNKNIKTPDYKKILQIKPINGCMVSFSSFNIKEFNLKTPCRLGCKKLPVILRITDKSPLGKKGIDLSDSNRLSIKTMQREKDLLKYEPVLDMKYCTKCILPETFPNIYFDSKGVCNFCNSHKKINYLGIQKLLDEIEKYKSKDGSPDVIVGFSGGRDSSFALHYIKKVLKMNPIAYSYDWGMLTDLGRRNQARMCGKLGVEHIIVSADIIKKRENIKKNIIAWLKKPSLGMVPLFMAGDKQYFYYMEQLKKQTGINLVIFGENPLERTDFKSGFYGIEAMKGKKQTFKLSLLNKIRLAAYYFREYISNPPYVNSSLFDSIFAYLTYYSSHEYLNLYNYIKWDEDTINRTLIEKYNWETSLDTKTTWRIGDGTASFYNYIYYTIAGFNENHTFRSNQIREGLISRKDALNKVMDENKPRYESLKWYCDTIGIDFTKTIKKINSVEKIYEKKKIDKP